MEIFINNELLHTQEDITLIQLLKSQGIAGQKGIAVALNNAVIPKAEWKLQRLNTKDNITVIKATQGG